MLCFEFNVVKLNRLIMAFNFEKLQVWKTSVDFSGDIYDMTKAFPKEELFGLTSQIRRAADSISLNIAEGSTGQTKKEFQKFLGYSIRSGTEVIGCLYLARRKGILIDQDFKKYYNALEILVIKLQALRKSLCESGTTNNREL